MLAASRRVNLAIRIVDKHYRDTLILALVARYYDHKGQLTSSLGPVIAGDRK
jgi:hypothetical protein